VKKTTSWLIFALLVSVVILFVNGRIMKQRILDLRHRVLSEESARSHEDDQVRLDLNETLSNVLTEVESLSKEVKELSSRQDPETQLPEEYTRKVRSLITDEIDALVNQPPVFGPAWEILSIRFLSPDLISVQCRDGQIDATLLVLIYAEDKGTYAGEVLYSNVKPWAG